MNRLVPFWQVLFDVADHYEYDDADHEDDDADHEDDDADYEYDHADADA